MLEVALRVRRAGSVEMGFDHPVHLGTKAAVDAAWKVAGTHRRGAPTPFSVRNPLPVSYPVPVSLVKSRPVRRQYRLIEFESQSWSFRQLDMTIGDSLLRPHQLVAPLHFAKSVFQA